MHLIKTTDDFSIASSNKPNFPIVLWENMSSCREANDFLRFYLTRAAIGSENSWEPIARAIYDYFGFLEANELAWDDVDRGEEKILLAAYRDYSFEVARLSRNTVRDRLRYICIFYKFAQSRGWIQGLPYEYEARYFFRPRRFLAHLDASGGTVNVRSAMPRKHRNLVKFLTKKQVETLLLAAENSHHHMIIRFAVQSGLRRSELSTFPLAYVFDPDRAGIKERNVCVTLDPADGTGMKTKGNVARVIYISRRLMSSLHHYVVHRRGERASLNKWEPKAVFLNHEGRPWSGSGKGMSKEVQKIGAKVGIDVHIHMLRHTYSTHTLAAMQRYRGDTRIEPLVFLQNQLGHASVMTTMKYAHLINELADKAVLAYDEELNDWIEANA